MLADIRSVAQCGDNDAAAGTCPVASQVGRVTVGAGAGSTPVYLPQAGKAPTAVYFAGPYKGAPYSLSIVVPGQAGPFDLGTVVVRAALFVDPDDAHVTVVSDPIPTILDGVPLNVQKVDVTIDRPGFMVNPTSCRKMQVSGTVTSDQGASAAVASRFQVGGCADLGYQSRLALTLSGKGQTGDGAHPALSAHMVPNTGDAESARVRVTLPLALALDPGNANALCEPVDAAAHHCPATSIVGTARAASVLPDPERRSRCRARHAGVDLRSRRVAVMSAEVMGIGAREPTLTE